VNQITPLSKAIGHALGAMALFAASGMALAQSPAPAQDAATQQEPEPTTLAGVQVTGSRIKKVDAETSQPILSLSREDIQAQGLATIGEAIQNISANGSSLNRNFNAVGEGPGSGESGISLRNLGSNRTLVLVNGRRWVGGTGLGGAVDLNSIPTAAVDRIEVLKDGASVIYGSDAIAGVVNIILRDEFDGAEANAYYGQYSFGDGARQSYDFTIGGTGERHSLMLGLGYIKQDAVWAGDREISSVPNYGLGLAGGSTTTPNGTFGLCTGVFDPVEGTCSVAETRPDGSTGTFSYDPGQSGLNWRNTTPADRYNFAPDNYLTTPQELKSLFASGKLDITDTLRFKLTATYNERDSSAHRAAQPLSLGSGPGAVDSARRITISPDNIYNPFGQTVSRIQRRPNDQDNFRVYSSDVDTFAVNLGLEGSLALGERYLDWEAGYFHGENDNHTTITGLFSTTALANALGPSFIDADGNPVCGTPGQVIAGCVPLNLLGAEGSITQEMLDYATFTAHNRSGYEQRTYYLNVTGDLLDLPGGPLAYAAGIEHRKESGFEQPDAHLVAGDSTGAVGLPTDGGFDLDEAYIEFSIPVLADVPGARLLDFSLASRYSDYSNFGNTTNSKFGFRWKPVDDLMVRGNYTEGFRAPSIYELFAGVSDQFESMTDPCSHALGGAPGTGAYAELSPEQQARCQAQGVPAGGYDQANSQIRTTGGGNAELQPETATTKTLGLVYSPGWAPGLGASLDWWQIELEDTIESFTGQQILDRCIRDGNEAFCEQYDRSSSGQVLSLLSTPQNIGSTLVEGYDLAVSYRIPEQAWGRLSITWETTYLSRVENDENGNGIRGERATDVPEVGQPFHEDEGGNLVGRYRQSDNNWRIRSNLLARWERGAVGATWNVRYLSRQTEHCPGAFAAADLCSDPDRFVDVPTDVNGNGLWDGEGIDALVPTASPRNSIGGTVYHDLSFYVNTPWQARVTLGMNNAFDKQPPVANTAFDNSFDPQYDIPGRFFYMKYNQKF
jgi:iron complex outermembrane receptor protein